MSKKRLRPRLPTEFEIVMEPVYLSEEEDNGRIERLTRQILRIVYWSANKQNASKEEESHDSQDSIEKTLRGSLEETLNI